MALRVKGISGKVATDQLFHRDVMVYGEKVLVRVKEKERRGKRRAMVFKGGRRERVGGMGGMGGMG